MIFLCYSSTFYKHYGKLVLIIIKRELLEKAIISFRMAKIQMFMRLFIVMGFVWIIDLIIQVIPENSAW